MRFGRSLIVSTLMERKNMSYTQEIKRMDHWKYNRYPQPSLETGFIKY